jgi:rRNA maturation protein Nop10
MKKPLLEKLIQEIAMFDMDAACKLHVRKHLEEYENKDDLNKVMPWRKTTEGYGYWFDIMCKLEASRKNYHPHRDLMIELANDKTIEIEYLKSDGSWRKCSMPPSFNPNDKYRKKPKITKRVIEYRVYLDQENKIKTSYGTNPLPINFKQWLGDWQKVEIEVEENN